MVFTGEGDAGPLYENEKVEAANAKSDQVVIDDYNSNEHDAYIERPYVGEEASHRSWFKINVFTYCDGAPLPRLAPTIPSFDSVALRPLFDRSLHLTTPTDG